MQKIILVLSVVLVSFFSAQAFACIDTESGLLWRLVPGIENPALIKQQEAQGGKVYVNFSTDIATINAMIVDPDAFIFTPVDGKSTIYRTKDGAILGADLSTKYVLEIEPRLGFVTNVFRASDGAEIPRLENSLVAKGGPMRGGKSLPCANVHQFFEH